jgi:predicted O-methyltransferase YrrM
MNPQEEALLDYCERHSTAEHEWLQMCVRKTHLKHLNPRMLSGHVQGRLLSRFSGLMKPNLVLDIGTFTGYSAMCLAEGLAPQGKVITLEEDVELERSIRENIAASPFADQIEPVFEDALIWLGNHAQLQPDIIYLDADKSRYPQYLPLLLSMMRPNSMLIADNTLWSGKVLDAGTTHKDTDTQAIDQFNKMLAAQEQLEVFLLPLRDGLSIARKKN